MLRRGQLGSVIIGTPKLRRWYRREVCPGPDSNRHGVTPEGFSYPLQLSLLRACARIWGLDFTFTVPKLLGGASA